MPRESSNRSAGRLRAAIAEYERLRTRRRPVVGAEVQRLLGSIDAQFDAWVELLGGDPRARALGPEARGLVERTLLQLAVLRSRALALVAEDGDGPTR
jgi:hypothetical protein